MSAPASALADLQLTGQQWTALGKLTDSGTLFEPLAKRPGIGPKTVDRLMELGLVESGDPGPVWRQRGSQIGYRLTALGLDAREAEHILRTGRRVSDWMGCL
ncbi:hypothetical protein [uncultured Caulobacter sp.]|uniref:hypothetical protein n=1 Tax=uncultured Caulobacter sp. TaxID=158749 RepID=UPI002619C16F|nr:hypothetical protein [uncultured Caulobacter sp.]